MKQPETGHDRQAAGSLTADQPYGDLVRLNARRTILDSVGETLLRGIVEDFLSLVETSAAIFEENGDYAFGITTSGWCRFMDRASRDLCRTSDNREALASGAWHCRESCWQISKLAMESGKPVDRPCLGGIRIHAVPIQTEGRVIGAINFGYGDPPRARDTLSELARRYGVEVDRLAAVAGSSSLVTPVAVEQAKSRLATAAKLIGEIVQRKRFEKALQESESRFRQLAETLNDVVWLYDLATSKVLYMSPAYEVVWGRPVRDVYDDPSAWIEGVHPDDQERITLAWQPPMRGSLFDEVYRVVRPDGSVRYVHDRGYPVRDSEGRVYRLAGIVEDITDRRHVESELRLRERKLLQAFEEREALSRDLHDGVLQALYALGLEIDHCKHLMQAEPGTAVQRMTAAIGRLNAVIGQVRGFITGMEKPFIVMQDVHQAFEQIVSGFSRLSAMKIRLDLDPESARTMKTAHTAQLVYVMHEALSNSLRHGHARTAEVILRKGDRSHVLELRDDGIGFEVQEARERGRGLQNMKVRVGKLQGDLVIRSRLGQGTTIIITLPA